MFGIASLVLVPILLALAIHRPSPVPVQVAASPEATDPEAQAAALAHQLAHDDKTIWAKELEAQEYEAGFIALWDGLRARLDDQHQLLASQPFGHIHVRDFGPPTHHAWGVDVALSDGTERTLDHAQWQDLVARVAGQGERLMMSEWHHAAFDDNRDGAPHSSISFKLFLENRSSSTRSVVSGTLQITWGAERDHLGHHIPADIDATKLMRVSRSGEPPFQEAYRYDPTQSGSDPHCFMDPVVVTDLQGDGRQDILLPSLNVELENTSTPGAVSFTPKRLFRSPVSTDSLHEAPYVSAAVAGDFAGFGRTDLLVCGPSMAPRLFVMNEQRRYDDEPLLACGLHDSAFQFPVSMSAGDVTGDGRLDVWIGQYRWPYINGNLPNPYYDAEDGPPSYLFLNRGQGRFVDATQGSGLESKRHRRNWSAALVPLTGSKLDLITINDFSGIDLFAGDGAGHFRDVTAERVDQRTSFGMSLLIGDFLDQGRLDLYVCGMGSTTARRLAHMGLGRDDLRRETDMRAPMAYGNRMLLNDGAGSFHQAPFNDSICRTGWSWGSAMIDPDNDGNTSIFVANGHMSRTTAKDYCSRYWTHDIYLGASADPRALNDFFRTQAQDIEGMSWNPFEHKALLMNEGGGRFLDVAYLMGLGLEYDSREAVAVDLDGDGATDLVLVEYRMGERPYDLTRPVLHVYQNRMKSTNHWLSVRLPESRTHHPYGALIDITCGDWHARAVISSGEGFRSQSPTVRHFGLGGRATVDSVRVRWSDGTERTVERPQIDRELVVSPDR